MPLKQGTYALVGGPSFETPAELRLMQVCGVDAVGMSTVQEAITARHCSIEVMGFSLITNKCNMKVRETKRTEEELDALTNEVLDVAKSRENDLRLFISTVIERMRI